MVRAPCRERCANKSCAPQFRHRGCGGRLAAGDAPSARARCAEVASRNRLATRLDQLAALQSDFNSAAATDDDKRAHQIARLQIIFGNSFVLLPQFSVGDAAELEQALADSAKIQDDDALAVVTWFQRASRVREGGAARRVAFVTLTRWAASAKLRIEQLPYGDDRGVG